MKNQRKWLQILFGGALVLVLALGGMAALAQTDGDDSGTGSDDAPTETLPVPAPGRHGFGRFGSGGLAGDRTPADELLADALGISVDDLRAAQNQVHAARLADMVDAGVITQEQADLMLAQKAVQSYIDAEALQAAVQAAYEDAVAQALADGAITQEQADQLLSSQAGFPGFGGGFGGHRGPGRGPMRH